MFTNGIGVSTNHSAAIALVWGASLMIGGCGASSGGTTVECGIGMSLAPGGYRCVSVCGDGLKNADEECDDKNVVSGDGCSDQCKLEGRVCDTTVQPTVCPPECEPDTDCGGGRCANTSWGPTCVCGDHIGSQCEKKKCEITAGTSFTVAIDHQGTVVAWGDNASGQLADPTVEESRPEPAPIVAPPDMGDIHKLNASPVGNHTLALDNKGTIWSWGEQTFGQLGESKKYKDDVVHYISTGAFKVPVTEIAAGTTHSLAIFDSNVYAWGEWKVGGSNNEFTKIAACDGFNLAINDEGRLYSWGIKNESGQLGNGSNSSQMDPTEVSFPFPTVIAAIACGQSHSLALSKEGDVWAWGSNKHNQLGDTSAGNSSTPVKISFDDDVSKPGDARMVAIAAGANHNVALDVAGHVWTWGNNSLGQRGNGSDVAADSAPNKVKMSSSKDLLPDVKSIDAGGNFTLAMDANGTLWVWGDNTKGQLGYGSYDKVLSPEISQFKCSEESLW